jgi:hypothetical protein
VEIELVVKRGKGKLSPQQVKEVLDTITTELRDPESEVSQTTSRLGLKVSDLRLGQEYSAFVAETFLIGLAIHFAQGVAGGVGTGAGVLFFNEVIKKRIARKSANGVISAEERPAADVDARTPAAADAGPKTPPQ